jgi:predicted amidohydrolase YtcJ
MSAPLSPELIIVNADIHTMDPLLPRARALAVTRERVSALGGDDEISALAGTATRIIDAGGRIVFPGFQDTHLHLQDSGLQFALNIKLDSAETIPQLQKLIGDFAKAHPDRAWINGGGWYAGIFGEDNLDRTTLDAVVPDRPAFFFDSNYHSAVINTKACEILGLDETVADPPNGHFVRDAKGKPTGMLYEDAIDWAREKMPVPSDEDYAQGVRWGQRHCNEHGITGVLDASVTDRHMRVYHAIEKAGELTVRICATARVAPEETADAALARVEALRRDYRSQMLRVHSAKFFLDGIFENRTAAMLSDYSDAIGGNAPVMFGENHLRDLFVRFDAARFQIHAHVIGDKAARAGLDALEAARDINGAWPSLHQLAHVQSIDPADIPRFRELGVVANIQPLWARSEPSVTHVTMPMVGPERTRWVYAFKSLLDAGAPFTLSSDWGVSTLNPFQIIETAITRQPPGKEHDHPAFIPEERIGLADCLRGYTVNAAAAAWRSEDTGSLAVGKFGDLIMLDRDIFAIDAYDIGDTKVLLTLLGGREVYRRQGW